MSRLEIRLFGSFQAALAGETITGFESSKVRALLAYLAADTKRTHPRDSLAGLLWPDWPQRSAMSNLRYALADLRKNIRDPQADPPILLISRESIGLNPEGDCWVDVVEFEKLALSIQQPALSNLRNEGRAQSEINNLQSAINLYRGEFLEGFALNDSPAFEEWILAKREYLKRQALKAMHTLAETHQQRGEYEPALSYSRRQLELEPWLEEAHRQVMRLLAQSGQRSAALAQYETCQRLLAKELGVKPSAETTRLYEAIRDERLSMENTAQAEATTGVPAISAARKEAGSVPLPLGTVTFLFTDIQGSTPLWEREPEKMAEALQIHNRALRQAIEANGGVVFKIVGDTFQAAFAIASQALKAAIEAQRALQSAPWNELGPLRVRMGLHTGEAELDPGGDEYTVSHTKNRADRIMSAAHGGQVLLSAETAELVNHQLPPGVSLKDRGEHRLKGMALLERLFQACAPGLPQEFPSLSTTVTHPNNLPVKLTSFVGRENEIAAVCRLLAGHRLVTLTGSGGTGKTRLSLQVAGLVLEQYPNGAWLVELAPLADPALVPQTVASALHLPETPGKTILDALVDFLRLKRLLLILDNCEHLLEACAGLADTLIHACPELTILASSREFLGVEGEASYRVPPMAVPDPRRLPPLGEITGYDAVRLFLERALAGSPGFAITAENAATVAQVVHRLDGIPLAIELAASRLRLLSVEQIAQRLDDAFRLLTGGSRTMLPRHQTLRALIDWSYNLLSEPERILLRRLSVFAGGWSLEAAEQVCAHELADCQPLCPEDILDLLSKLVDKSLILATQGQHGEMRFTMLETIRQYAHEKLVDEKEAEAVRARHLAYYLGLAEELEPKIRSREQIQTLDRLELELDNLRLAMGWALQTDVEGELRLASALMYFWHIRFHWSEGMEWLEKGLALEQDPPAGDLGENRDLAQARSIAIRAKALSALGVHLSQIEGNPGYQTDFEKSIAALEESVALYREAGPEYRHGLAIPLRWLSFFSGDQALVREALDLCREINDQFGIFESLLFTASYEPDQDQRSKILLECLAIAKMIGDEDATAAALERLGVFALRDGEYEKARDYYMESRVHFRRAGNSTSVVRQAQSIFFACFFLGDYPQAAQWLDEALDGFREIDDTKMWISCLELKTELSITQGFFNQAFQCMEEIQAISQNTSRHFHDALRQYFHGVIFRLQGKTSLAFQNAQDFRNAGQELENWAVQLAALSELGKLSMQERDLNRARAYFKEALLGEGEVYLLGYGDVYWYSRIFANIAGLDARHGEMEPAARFYGAAMRFHRGMVNTLPLADRLQLQADLAAVRAALGETRFEQLYDEGRTLTLEQAVAYALEDHD